MAKVLVLGGNGFIGSHLVDSLVECGHNVRVFDRNRENLHFNEHPNIEVMTGDFLNRNDIAAALKNMEYVFHLVSTTTPITAENDPMIDIDTNVRGSIELFRECANAKIKRLIFASTGGAIYGQDLSRGLREDDIPLPVSPYAIGKLTIEHYLRYFKTKHNLDSITFRISNPYGERQPLQSKQGVIPIFLESIYRNEPITILGDGSMVRDYIHVKDVAAIMATVFDREATHPVYNVGSGRGVSVNELVSLIEEVVGRNVQKTNAPMPPTFIQKVVLDTTRINNEFQCRPLTSLRDGVAGTWSYIHDEHNKDHQR